MMKREHFCGHLVAIFYQEEKTILHPNSNEDKNVFESDFNLFKKSFTI